MFITFCMLIEIPYSYVSDDTPKTTTRLVVPFFVSRGVTAPGYNFSPGTVFALINTSFLEELFSATILLCFQICSSCLLILIDVASSTMMSFSRRFVRKFFCKSLSNHLWPSLFLVKLHTFSVFSWTPLGEWKHIKNERCKFSFIYLFFSFLFFV